MTDQERYLAAMHAMQSGVAMELELDPTGGSPKHLRTGLNGAMRDHGSLVALLISKGLLTSEEYLKAIADGAEAEAEAYQQRLSARLGAKVTLV